MTFECHGMMLDGFESEEQARRMAPEIMEEALMAGYDPARKPFMCENGEDGDEEKN